MIMEQLAPGGFGRTEKALQKQYTCVYEQPYGYTGTEGVSSINLTEEPSDLLSAAIANPV